MSTLDLTAATQGFDMRQDGAVAFDTIDSRLPARWSFITADGHDIELDGTGFAYDANGRALNGTVAAMFIDLGNNNFSNPDVVIRGVDAPATQQDGGRDQFWDFLGGDDDIFGPLIENAGTQASFFLFGDAHDTLKDGAPAIGDDLFRAGDAKTQAVGDVVDVNNANIIGGNDRIFFAPTELSQSAIGDVLTIQGIAFLGGGDDIIAIRSVNTSSIAVGDAATVHGFGGGRAEVRGGDDKITAENGSAAQLAGDVLSQFQNSIVLGGSDVINGSERGEAITGDVFNVFTSENVTVTGGGDTLNGNGGNDVISGDVHVSVRDVTITGGNDVIHGGEGADSIFGETAVGSAVTTGGNDSLFGDAGNDTLAGQSGNDILDGGEGADVLNGGVGRDAASYASAAAGVIADLLDAAVNTGDAAGDSYAVESLTGSSFSDSLRGDNAANAVFGGLGNDVVIGRGGNDRLLGQGGRDRLDGGTGNDLLAGGGGIDTFVFRAGYNTDRITDYNDAQDRLDLQSFGFDSFAEITAIATDTAAGLRLDFGGSDFLIVENFKLAQFEASDVIL